MNIFGPLLLPMKDEEGNGDKDDKDEPRKDTAAGQPDVGSEFPGEDEDSEMEDNGEADQYQKEGLTKPDIPEEELELPDDMNMDGDQVLEEGVVKKWRSILAYDQHAKQNYSRVKKLGQLW